MRTLLVVKFISFLIDKKCFSSTKFAVLCNFHTLGQQLSRAARKLTFFASL